MLKNRFIYGLFSICLTAVNLHAQMPTQVIIVNFSNEPVWVRVKDEQGVVLQEPILLTYNAGINPIQTGDVAGLRVRLWPGDRQRVDDADPLSKGVRVTAANLTHFAEGRSDLYLVVQQSQEKGFSLESELESIEVIRQAKALFARAYQNDLVKERAKRRFVGMLERLRASSNAAMRDKLGAGAARYIIRMNEKLDHIHAQLLTLNTLLADPDLHYWCVDKHQIIARVQEALSYEMQHFQKAHDTDLADRFFKEEDAGLKHLLQESSASVSVLDSYHLVVASSEAQRRAQGKFAQYLPGHHPYY